MKVTRPRDSTSLIPAKIGGLGVSAVLKCLMGSLDYKIVHFDMATDPARPEFQGRYIFVFWHEYITFPVTLWGGCNVAALVSHHRDAEIVTHAARHLGFQIVRGSSTRGGAAAVRQLQRMSGNRNLTLMPDGPKGPRRRMAVGPIYLSSRLQIPLVPVGFGFDRPWRMPSWDRFAVPRPYSRARSIFGPPMHIPDNLDRGGLERYRQQAEQLLNSLTGRAEAWAVSGARMSRQFPIRRWRQPRGVAYLTEPEWETAKFGPQDPGGRNRLCSASPTAGSQSGQAVVMLPTPDAGISEAGISEPGISEAGTLEQQVIEAGCRRKAV